MSRCLTDDTLPLEAERFHHDQQNAFLTLAENPVVLPPKFAVLIETQIAQPATTR